MPSPTTPAIKKMPIILCHFLWKNLMFNLIGNLGNFGRHSKCQSRFSRQNFTKSSLTAQPKYKGKTRPSLRASNFLIRPVLFGLGGSNRLCRRNSFSHALVVIQFLLILTACNFPFLASKLK